MPIYTFRCGKCDVLVDEILPVENRDEPVACVKCGEIMKRQISLPLPAIYVKTGKGMALDSLNSNNTVPHRWYKPQADALAAAGLDTVKKTLGIGF